MEENQHDTYYEAWKHHDAATLLRVRYENGIRLRSTHPRTAYPDYVHACNAVINRILSERGA